MPGSRSTHTHPAIEASFSSLKLRLEAFEFPVIRDAVVIGRSAAVDEKVMAKLLRALSPEEFTEIPGPRGDRTVGAILARRAVLLKVDPASLRRVVLRRIKPLMTPEEIVVLRLEIEISLGGPLKRGPAGPP